jgi:hypothetical protein
MPFDGKQVVTPALRRAILVDALRDEMPQDFKWNFSQVHSKHKCGSSGCAIGLARTLWPEARLPTTFDYDWSLARLANFLGLERDVAHRIFLSKDPYGVWYDDVTPVMVADELEKLGG